MLVFVLICAVFGGLIGFGAGMLGDAIEGDSSYEEEIYEEETDIPKETVFSIIECAALAIGTATTFFALQSSDLGSDLSFTMADVNLLFASPLKPQSVLLFKLLTQIGTAILASIYLIFQINNLVINLSLSVLCGFALVLCWIFILSYYKLFQTLAYTVSASHTRYRKTVRSAIVALLAAVAVAFYLYYKNRDVIIFDAALAFFSAPAIRFIPVIGWFAGLAHFALLGEIIPVLIYSLLLSVCIALLIYVIWHTETDFYETSLAKSAEKDEAVKAAAEGRIVVQNKTARKNTNRTATEGIGHGNGANVFFFKELYNRFRFAYLRVFTKTSITYLITSATVCLITFFFFDSRSFTPVALALCVFVFYRSLGNPINADIEKPAFVLIPENTHKKLFFSLLAGTVSCLLDLLPAMILSAIFMKVSPLSVVLWTLFIVSIDFYSSSVGTFIELSLRFTAAKIVKTMIQICFIYFGLVPIAALMGVGIALDVFLPCAICAALFATLCGLVFFALSPIFINNGRR